MPAVQFLLMTPPPGPSGAAIAIIQLTASTPTDLDEGLQTLKIRPVAVGSTVLRRLGDIDTGVVARLSPTCAQLMPHAGRFIVSTLLDLLGRTPGFAPMDRDASGSPRSLFPEADDFVEACALEAISRAASPLAVGAIMRQSSLWRNSGRASTPAPTHSTEDSRALDRLLTPPTIVLLGPPNIGKSTLTNTIARRHVSIVADQPGTTRDHVGVMLDLAGLVVRWIDAPGIGMDSADPIDRDASALALDSARRADLILTCLDRTAPPPDPAMLTVPESIPILRVLLRADLGEASGEFDAVTSSVTGQGIADLAIAVRQRMVPTHLLRSESLWRFHPALPG